MRGENGIRPGSSLPPALRATSLAEGVDGLQTAFRVCARY